MKNVIDYSLMASNMTSGCVYIVFIANTFHDICNGLFDWSMSVRMYILFTVVPIMIIGHIRHLKYLVPTSGLANALIITTMGIVLYYIFKEPLDFSDKPLIVHWTKWPIFLT